MHVSIGCFECINGGRLGEGFTLLPYRDDARYEWTCPNGHTTVVVLQQQRFEILFELGAHALLDGYPREAVASFASSLERFYEFFVKSSFFQRGLDGDTVEKAWKPVSKQSERQLGAFIAVYVRDLGRTPILLAQNLVELRNRVIHQGAIPTSNEAIRFGQGVLDAVRPAIREAKAAYPDGSSKKVWHHLATSRHRENEGRRVATGSHRTIITLMEGDWQTDQPLEQALEELRTRRQNMSFHPTARAPSATRGG